jgi:hypothetical protein
MGIDESGQQGRTGQVSHGRALRGVPARIDREDGGAVDHHHRIGDQRGASAIEQPRGPQHSQGIPPARRRDRQAGTCRHLWLSGHVLCPPLPLNCTMPAPGSACENCQRAAGEPAVITGLPAAGGGTWPEPLTMGRDRCSRRRGAVESRWRWLRQRLGALSRRRDFPSGPAGQGRKDVRPETPDDP